jgi:hypothetical protein
MSGVKSQPIRKVVDSLSNAILDIPLGEPTFADDRYHPHNLKVENFFPLPKKMNTGKIAFIDGGRAEILCAPSFAIGLNRTYFALFQGDKRQEPTKMPSKIDFYTVCYPSVSDNNIVYKTELVTS